MILEMVKSSVVQLGRYPFSNVFLALLMRTRSPTLNLGVLDLEGFLGPYKVFHTGKTLEEFTSTGVLRILR